MRAAPVFANAIPGLQFGLEGLVGPVADGAREERYDEAPVLERAYANGQAHAVSPPSPAGTALALSGDALARTLRFLEEARFSGLVTHLFALRAFMPTAVGSNGTSVRAVTDALRDDLDRLFIKLRLPTYSVAPRDVETPGLRSAVEQFLADAAASSGMPEDAEASALRGGFDPVAMRDLADRVREAPQASAVPWAALARLLPDSAAQAQHYRSLLVERLDEYAAGDASAFVDALQMRRDTVLDGALDVFLASLRVAVS